MQQGKLARLDCSPVARLVEAKHECRRCCFSPNARHCRLRHTRRLRHRAGPPMGRVLGLSSKDLTMRCRIPRRQFFSTRRDAVCRTTKPSSLCIRQNAFVRCGRCRFHPASGRSPRRRPRPRARPRDVRPLARGTTLRRPRPWALGATGRAAATPSATPRAGGAPRAWR